MGLLVDWRRNALFSESAQICPCDWKTKYFPSAVHLPQHSSGGLCHPGNNGCRFVPCVETSQSEFSPVFSSHGKPKLYFRWVTTSDKSLGPVSETNFRDSVPSLLARNNSLPLT